MQLQKIEVADMITSPKKVIEWIKERSSPSGNIGTINQYLSAVRWRIKQETSSVELLKPYKEFQESLRKLRDEKAKSQTLPEEKKDGVMTWKDIEGLNDKAKEILSPQSYMIYALYTMTPPVRADYANMVLVNYNRKDKSKNYCVVSKKNVYFVFNHYKTSNTYGQVVLTAPDDLAKVVRDTVGSHSFESGKSMLLGDMTENALSVRVKDIFERLTGKNMSINSLRHSYITSFLSTPKTIRQKEVVAQKMLHSYITQETYAVMEEGDD
jgi:hypothetical protein